MISIVRCCPRECLGLKYNNLFKPKKASIIEALYSRQITLDENVLIDFSSTLTLQHTRDISRYQYQSNWYKKLNHAFFISTALFRIQLKFHIVDESVLYLSLYLICRHWQLYCYGCLIINKFREWSLCLIVLATSNPRLFKTVNPEKTSSTPIPIIAISDWQSRIWQANLDGNNYFLVLRILS